MTENQKVPGRKRRSGEEIKRLVLEFEASGLRQNEFCRNHGLALSTLQRQLTVPSIPVPDPLLRERRLRHTQFPKTGGKVYAFWQQTSQPHVVQSRSGM
jgi:hypothetical protein